MTTEKMIGERLREELVWAEKVYEEDPMDAWISGYRTALRTVLRTVIEDGRIFEVRVREKREVVDMLKEAVAGENWEAVKRMILKEDILNEESRGETKKEKIIKYYVTMTDRLQKEDAKDKISKLIFVCDGYEEAEIVKENVEERPEMKYINISTKKPYYNKDRYHAEYKTNEGFNSWYMKDFFKDKKARQEARE